MDINRDIEPPFTYSGNLVRYLIVIVIIVILILILDKLFGKKIISIVKKSNIPRLKNKYTKKLSVLYSIVQNNKIDIRSGYIELSNIVREFVEKATGIKASSFSKSDAHAIGLDDLGLLMEEYYPPEFAKNETGDILKSIDKSMEVIRRWNMKS